MEEIENQIRSIEQGQDRLSHNDERQLCDLKKRLDTLRKETHRHNLYHSCGDWIGCVLLNWYDMKSLKRGLKMTLVDGLWSWGESIPACKWHIFLNKVDKIELCTSVRVRAIFPVSALLFTDSAMEYK